MNPIYEERVLGRTLRYRPLSTVGEDGVKLAVQDWAVDGQPRAADLLLVHGFSQSHGAWMHQVTGPLARRFRLVTFDLRGHGGSDQPDGPAYYRESMRWAADLAAVMAAAGLIRPVLVAWSYGGRVVLDYLSLCGDAGISGLVLVNATATATPDVLGPQAGVLRDMASAEPSVARAATLALLRACMARDPSAPELDYMLRYNDLVPPRVRAHLTGRPADYAPALRTLCVPTLVIYGKRDPIYQPAMAAYTAKMVQHARVLLYEEGAHMPFWECATRFDEDVTRFVLDDVATYHV